MDLNEAVAINAVFNDLIEVEEAIEDGVQRHYHNNRINPFLDMSDEKFIQVFRLDKGLAQILIDMITPYMEEGQTANSLSIRTKVLVALLFFGHGTYQKVTCKNIFCGISQSCVSRCIKEVSMALNQNAIINQWINFPQNLHELQALRARFPGSSHDAHIWRQCNMSQLMEAIYRNNPENNFFLLGASGYPLRPWLLTPLRNVMPGTPEERFNVVFKRTRSIIERCNGVLTNRWRYLLKHRVLHYSPVIAGHIIKACCVLHNMCISRNIALPVPEEDAAIDYGIVNIDPQEIVEYANADLFAGRHIQQQIINNHFVG